jgi:hypothetical protein
MTERPARPEVSAFLHDRATALDREASPVTADEAARRTIVDASKPTRQWPAALRPAKVHASPRSALAAAAVVALIVGAVGGFAVGRGSAPKHATVATAATNAPRSDVPGSTTTVPALTANGFGGASVSASGSAVNQGTPMTRLFDRTTSEGIDLHGFHQDQGVMRAVPECPANTWCAPAECYSSNFQLEAANAGAVGQTGSPGYPLHDDAALTSPFRFGDAEGSPAVGFILNTSDQVAKVEARWSDGFVDSMAPSSGWAVVAHNGTNVDATITAFSNTGTALKTFSGNGAGFAQPPSECMPTPPPPPTLPPAGAEQPDDSAAARQAITNAYQTVFTHGSDPATNAQYIEDPDSIQQAADTTRSNFPEAVDTVTVNVGDIVFTSKTEAALYFELKYQGGAEFGQQIGYAKLIDGTWKIAHDTMCKVLSWGGGQCSAGPASPPGSPTTTVVVTPTPTPGN